MRFSTFLLLFFLFFQCLTQAKAQNLIADWSAEEYVKCPYTYTLEIHLPSWIAFRGTPDYFHTCSELLGPTNNQIGYQFPKSGDGMIGGVQLHPTLSNGREYMGVELIEPLVIGESYDISFYTAVAYSENPWLAGRVINNLGFLLMTENYLSSNELGPIPNFAHFKLDTLVGDTAEWTPIFTTVVADSAYKFIAFGNFYDDASTIDSILPGQEFTALAYYFFDDFCVVPSGGDCMQVLSAHRLKDELAVGLYPNPAQSYFKLTLLSRITGLFATNALGYRVNLVFTEDHQPNTFHVDTRSIPSGIYILHIETEEGLARKKVVIQH